MSNHSYFNRFSIQGSQNPHSYMKLLKGSSGEKYAFIAVDACLPLGLKRPFNFIGVITQENTNHLQKLINEAKSAGASYTIWFGHYPTSCIITMNDENRDLKRIIGDNDNSLAYMCGHLHTLGGMIPNMYTLHDNKFLELEVADWKKDRTFRVAAVDGGQLSFIDVEHGKWPIILITNPKHSLFRIPNRNETQIQLGLFYLSIYSYISIYNFYLFSLCIS